MNELITLIASGLGVRPGAVTSIGADGNISVLIDGTETEISAIFLRTSNAPLPELREGTLVLVAIDSAWASGYILGVIESYRAPGSMDSKHNRRERGPDLPDNVSVYGRGRAETVHISARKIVLAADDEVQIKCGSGIVKIDYEGNVTVRGSKVLSRAKRANKIKGALVEIN